MVPFVERNYNLVELGPRGHRQEPPLPAGLALRAPDLRRQGDGREDVRQQRHRPARPGLPVRRRLLRRGVRRLLRPEGRREHHEGLHGVRRVQPRQGEHPGRRLASCMVGNFDVDVQHQQRIGHLFGPLPPEMRDDTAFMDRIHAYLPGWDVPKLSRELLHRPLRSGQRLPVRVLEPAARARAASRAAAGPRPLRRRPERSRHQRREQDGQRPAEAAVSPIAEMPRSRTRTWSGSSVWRWSAAGGSRSSRSGSAAAEFRNTHFSYQPGRRRRRDSSSPRRSCTATTASTAIRCRPARSGRSAQAVRTSIPVSSASRSTRGPAAGEDPQPTVATAVPGERPLRRAEPVRPGPGAGRRPGPAIPRVLGPAAGLRRLARPAPRPASAPCSPSARRLLQKSLKGGLIVVGGLNLGGSIEPIHNAVSIVEAAADKGAKMVLLPVTTRKQLVEL